MKKKMMQLQMSASLIAPTPVMIGSQFYLKVLPSYFSF